MKRSAMFSVDRLYRYTLSRGWGREGTTCMFIGLNPSTADEKQDDPTIRRCIGFAKQWGFDGLLMGNLFAYRATNPAELSKTEDPVGPDNDKWLYDMIAGADRCIAAWGAHRLVGNRAQTVIDMCPNIQCLGHTKKGHPKHPLYLRGDSVPTNLNPKGGPRCRLTR